jgi:hypothetical protein
MIIEIYSTVGDTLYNRECRVFTAIPLLEGCYYVSNP